LLPKRGVVFYPPPFFKTGGRGKVFSQSTSQRRVSSFRHQDKKEESLIFGLDVSLTPAREDLEGYPTNPALERG
jgi:hypothetical protein